MVLRCAWGTCNADERYPERLEGGRFVRFPTPKRDVNKCKRWIKACGRPHDQLNLSRINQHKAVCSKHFVGGKGPTDEFPDPMPADGTRCTPARRRLVKRALDCTADSNLPSKKALLKDITNRPCQEENDIARCLDGVNDMSTQTEEPWVSALDMLTLTAEVVDLKHTVEEQHTTIQQLQQDLCVRDKEIESLKLKYNKNISVKAVCKKEGKLKNIFQYYTGITYVRFMALLTFLVPDDFKVTYSCGRQEVKKMKYNNCLLLTLCRLRHGFGLKDLAMRFGIGTQSAGIIFNTWLDLLYFKLGQISIWPHRDEIIKNMPRNYKRDFPTSLIIIDGTEVKTQVPSALGLQSQMYSDYKSATTLKALIGCDPNGCLMFVSELYTGSISDKALTEQCGFYEVLKALKSAGYIKDGDAIMVDKGFNIDKEINSLGLKINIPPFASASRQMSPSEISLTNKIAKHRVHVERLICKVKTFKILSHCIPTSLFEKVNEVFSVCCHLTLFQDIFVKDKGCSSS